MQTTTTKKLLSAAILTVFAAAIMVQTVHAYTYTMANKSGVTIVRVYIHTLSAFCKNKNWTGSIENNGSATIEAQTGCLADSWEAWDSNGKHYGLSVPVGRGSETITINNDGTMAIN